MRTAKTAMHICLQHKIEQVSKNLQMWILAGISAMPIDISLVNIWEYLGYIHAQTNVWILADTKRTLTRISWYEKPYTSSCSKSWQEASVVGNFYSHLYAFSLGLRTVNFMLKIILQVHACRKRG